ncbi:hypothetical protein A2303_05175 [Candidatus Falkowbacteria bacterium RIFOXYB2_FULL_47_14]|uniref:Thymidylate kinase-like domain-containing protein n=1 Tax=Candidatus Falkowbacteria bacterium RIFOXYA2_FULL_47_19 TaxID=1797994 RepID=A0A1F5SJ69_9BACT|nr:MAG: hypothetical protein A2227_06555 [Candidatus Falkowbacteria bacterium RIFOXYA2_FULL_47_19]OGF35750.1 MAG: hypothetical protein A2468_05230 [Candidatus Falkowbacteria bacterium RIFOXYC2_FULL_46_15]OGF43308.1 MAG: hypothetical protein A2303_05175 [Candidatus Falkowbacteria bacterium RIFOXYB2_FULL_47_14]
MNINVKKIFVLEGLPGTGKTTIIKYFKKEDDFCAVNEVLPRDPGYDSPPNRDYFTHSDILKTEKIKNSRAQYCLLDRYFISTLAFNWALDKTYKTREYERVFAWYEDGIKRGRLLIPTLTFIIELSGERSFARKRREAAEDSDVPWHNRKFVEYFKEYYNIYFREVSPRERAVKIKGTETSENIINLIKKYSQSKNYATGQLSPRHAKTISAVCR